MLDSKIPDEELLFRAVPNVPSHWNPDTQKYSSSIFKDKRGTSVDREGGRDLAAVIARLARSRANLAAVVSISAGACRQIGTHPVYLPIEDNPFHAEIHESEEQERISQAKAKKLSNIAEAVFLQNPTP